jgi:hypothetical protein
VALSDYNKYKIRPTEPVLTDYGKSLEIDSYLRQLHEYKKVQPDHIIFRNQNLHRDLKVEIKRLSREVQMEDSSEFLSIRSKRFETMSPFKPLEKREPPVNLAAQTLQSFRKYKKDKNETGEKDKWTKSTTLAYHNLFT